MSPLTVRSSPTIVNIAVAGLGRVGQIHAANLTVLAYVKIVAVYDPSPAALQWAHDALSHNRVIFCSSFAEMIALPQVHLVFIATPTSEHGQQSIAAIEAGKHVFCEKPLSSSLEEAYEMLQLASLDPTRLFICGFSRRFDSSYSAACQAIQSGQLGRVHLIHSRTLDLSMLDSGVRGEDVDFFYQYASKSGGIFLDCLIHDIDLALYLFGADNGGVLPVPKRVWSTGSVVVYDDLKERGDVDNAVGTIEFWGGQISTLHGSRTMTHAHDTGSEVYGTKGKLTVNTTPRRGCLDISTRAGQVTPLQQSWWDRFAEAFETEAQEVVEAVRLRLEAASHSVNTSNGCCTAEVTTDDSRSSIRDKSLSTLGDPKSITAQTFLPPRNLTLESSVRVLEIAFALTRSLKEAREIHFDQQGRMVGYPAWSAGKLDDREANFAAI